MPRTAESSEWSIPRKGLTNATGQFDIADERSPREVVAVLESLGYEPVWKDWDAAILANS